MENKMPLVVVVGSSNTDLVIQCGRLPKPGETVLGGEFSQAFGGKGANQCVAAARAGAKVTFIGVHGNDEFGRQAKAALRSEGVDVRAFVERKGHSSGVALILVGGKGRQNMIAVARSANDSLSREDVFAARTAFRKARVVIASLEVPLAAVESAAHLAAEYGVPFVLNPAPARKLPKSLLRLVNTITPNEHEAIQMTGEKQPLRAAQRLHQMGCANVVVTLGERGVLVVDHTGERTIAAPHVSPVDTVGAGDCFTAWLSVGIAEGQSLAESAQRGVLAAAIAVTRAGAQAAMPYREEL